MAGKILSKPLSPVIHGVWRYAAVADLRGGQSPGRQELERDR